MLRFPVPSAPAEKMALLPLVQSTVAEEPVESVVQLLLSHQLPPALPLPGVAPLVSQ